MARKPRIDVPGVTLHVMVRGLNRARLFRDDQDREVFLDRLHDVLAWGHGQCLGWALMDNHVHLILVRGRKPLQQVMHRLNFWYAAWFNRKYGRRSSVLDGRYKALLVDAETYLLELVRYVHLNPVKAGIVDLPTLERWPWSGYAALMGNAPARFLSGDATLTFFGEHDGPARRALRRWMADGLEEGHSAELAARLERRNAQRLEGEVDSRVLGDARFVERVLAEAEEQDREQVALVAAGWSAEQVLTRVCVLVDADPTAVRAGRRTAAEVNARRLTAWLVSAHLSGTNHSLAKLLGVSGSAISRAVVHGERLADDHGLHSLDLLPDEVVTPHLPNEQKRPELLTVLYSAAEVMGIPADLLSQPTRRRDVSAARRLAAFVAVQDHDHRVVELARVLRRSHGVISRWSRARPEAEPLAALRTRLLTAACKAP